MAIYCDATFLNVRRDSVGKEALHMLVGIDAEGYKEVLDYGRYPRVVLLFEGKTNLFSFYDFPESTRRGLNKENIVASVR